MTEEELIYILRNMIKFLGNNETASKVHRVCDEVLAPPQLKIINLVYICGLSPLAVAVACDMPLRRVELLRRSALRFLLAALA